MVACHRIPCIIIIIVIVIIAMTCNYILLDTACAGVCFMLGRHLLIDTGYHGVWYARYTDTGA